MFHKNCMHNESCNSQNNANKYLINTNDQTNSNNSITFIQN
jgi:hypothetical protein